MGSQQALFSLTQWCYTGTITLKDWEEVDGDFLERLWNLACLLEMPEFANFTMRLLMAKYCWYRPSNDGDAVLSLKAAPYIYRGVKYVLKSHSGNRSKSRLVVFIKRILQARGPLAEEVINHLIDSQRQGYESEWRKCISGNPLLESILGEGETSLVNERALPMNPEFSSLFYLPAYVKDHNDWLVRLYEDEATMESFEYGDAYRDDLEMPEKFAFRENKHTSGDLLKSFKFALHEENTIKISIARGTAVIINIVDEDQTNSSLPRGTKRRRLSSDDGDNTSTPSSRSIFQIHSHYLNSEEKGLVVVANL
jgi:hypothetical protein